MLNVVLYIVSLVVYYHAELYYPEFMCICGDDNIPFIFLLLSILVYSIGYSTAYLVKFAPDSLIRLAKKSFGGILKGLSQGLSLFFIAINLYSIMIYLSALNGHLVDFNLPFFTL